MLVRMKESEIMDRKKTWGDKDATDVRYMHTLTENFVLKIACFAVW
jgi:hypothetical protein